MGEMKSEALGFVHAQSLQGPKWAAEALAILFTKYRLS